MKRVETSEEVYNEFERQIRAATSSQRDVLRARIVRLCADGNSAYVATRHCGEVVGSLSGRAFRSWSVSES
ncbi:MAG: hypothetical protein AAFX94_24970, partial [Myxococcota bacterium]